MQSDAQRPHPGLPTRRQTTRITRRHVLLMLGAAASLPLAAACGQQASTPAAKPADAPKPAAPPATTAPAAPAAAAQPTAAPKPTEAPAAAAKPADAAKPAAPAATTAPAAQAPAAAKPSGPLTFWLYKTRLDPFDKYRTDRIKLWGQQANVPVEVIEIGTSDYGKKIPAAIESKTMPDVLEAGDDWTALLQPRGLVADVTDLFKKIDAEQKWAAAAKSVSTWPDGKQYIIPIGTSANLLISRDDLLKDAGLTPPPKTWVDLFDYSAKAQKPPRFFGLGQALSNTSDANLWVDVLQSYGVRFADDQGKKATFGNFQKEAVEVIQLVAKGYSETKVFPPGVLTWDQTGDNDAFQSGRTIFAFNPLSIPAWIRDNKPDMLPGVGTYLKPAGPKMLVQPVGAVAMSVKADSPYKEKAMDLMYFLNDKEYYKDYWPKSQWGPTLENQYDNPAFEQSWLKVRVDLAKNGKPAAWPDIQTQAWAEMNTAFVIPRMLQSVVADNKKPEEAFQTAADEIDKTYKKYESS